MIWINVDLNFNLIVISDECTREKEEKFRNKGIRRHIKINNTF